MPQLSIIIVNYNVRYFLEQCLCSVIVACEKLEAEIIVVDNNSTDGSKAYFADKFATVQFIWSKENTGFAGGNLLGLQRATGDHILFLNPDTLVDQNCFSNCLGHFKTHPSCGALDVRMIDGNGLFLPESKRNLPNPISSFFVLTGLGKIFTSFKTINNYRADDLAIDEINTVPVLSGAFMMMRRSVVESVGIFDPAFFMYGEDIDLSYRITKAGYLNQYIGTISIIHFKGESNGIKDKIYVKRFYGAMEIFVRKYFNPFKALVSICMIKIAAIIAGIKYRSEKKRISKPLHINSLLCICAEENQALVVEILRTNTPGSTYHFVLPEATKDPIYGGSAKFCLLDTTGIGLSQSIKYMQANAGRFVFLFFNATTKTIISSANKDTAGFCWHL